LTYQSVQQHNKRLDLLLRLPTQNLKKVLREDAAKLGTLGIRIGTILIRRLRKKAARLRGRRVRATTCFRAQNPDNAAKK
jgi:hypothetical protein